MCYFVGVFVGHGGGPLRFRLRRGVVEKVAMLMKLLVEHEKIMECRNQCFVYDSNRVRRLLMIDWRIEPCLIIPSTNSSTS